MNIYRKVTSSWNGVVEEVFVHRGSYVYEWEPLFLIKTLDGSTKIVQVNTSGDIEILKVKKGDHVTIESELAILQEDFLPTGCD
ncbi:hypothetical protein [Alkalihalobacillus sp. BA299]|uniref:hypothetical protein n=1 Tax=Alkalihalobacillus sp. BA299 TaxID=2815938 RepID=UPI001ADCBE67|nr:hypothetical protein [Alkalihalobacillus sp. BA299]